MGQHVCYASVGRGWRHEKRAGHPESTSDANLARWSATSFQHNSQQGRHQQQNAPMDLLDSLPSRGTSIFSFAAAG